MLFFLSTVHEYSDYALLMHFTRKLFSVSWPSLFLAQIKPPLLKTSCCDLHLGLSGYRSHKNNTKRKRKLLHHNNLRRLGYLRHYAPRELHTSRQTQTVPVKSVNRQKRKEKQSKPRCREIQCSTSYVIKQYVIFLKILTSTK